MTNTLEGLYWKGYEGQDYEQFWRGPAKHYLDTLERAIASHCLRGGDSVVEVGAGFGRLGSCYVGKYRSAHMVEPASNLRAIAREAYGAAVEYHEAQVEKLPFRSDSIDAVLMVRVFHHLGDPGAALHEIRRILRPGGLLVFNYSNRRNLRRVARFAIGRGSNPFTGRMEKYHEFLIGHNPSDVERMLDDDAFDIREQYGVGVVDKLVGAVPSLSKVLKPSLRLSRALGSLKLAPAQFVVAVKR